VHLSHSAFASVKLEERIFALFKSVTTPEVLKVTFLFHLIIFNGGFQRVLQCVNTILQGAVVPWSAGAEAFAENASRISEAAAAAVDTHRRMASVKQLLLKYQLPELISHSAATLNVNFFT
jgi:hypothetical protein